MSADPTTNSAVTALAENVLLIVPTLSYWPGLYQLPKDKVEVHFQSAPSTPETDNDIVLDEESTTRSQLKLLTDSYPVSGAPDGKPWKKIFGKLRSTQSAIVNRYSTGFPDMPGIRLVPKVSGAALFGELDELKRELDEIADLFCRALPDVLVEIQSKQKPGVWEAIRHKIPHTAEKMRKKFGSAAMPIEISGGNTGVLSMQELQAYRGSITSQINSRVESAIEEMISAPRRELAAAIDGLAELLGQNGRITDRSFNAVKTAMGKLKSFSFAASPELLARMRSVEDTVNAADSAQLRSSETSRDRMIAAIRNVGGELRDATQISSAVEAFTRRPRRVAV